MKDELGFDACIDYKAEKDLDAALRAACPNGVDVYFDNVGGEISDAVLRNINFFGRVALCGSISQYNATAPPMGPRLLGTFVGKRVTCAGLHRHRLRRAAYEPGDAPDGRVDQERASSSTARTSSQGIDKAPRAFIGLLRGENFGKLLVKM